jgi:hypothetical protein
MTNLEQSTVGQTLGGANFHVSQLGICPAWELVLSGQLTVVGQLFKLSAARQGIMRI